MVPPRGAGGDRSRVRVPSAPLVHQKAQGARRLGRGVKPGITKSVQRTAVNPRRGEEAGRRTGENPEYEPRNNEINAEAPRKAVNPRRGAEARRRTGENPEYEPRNNEINAEAPRKAVNQRRGAEASRRRGENTKLSTRNSKHVTRNTEGNAKAQRRKGKR